MKVQQLREAIQGLPDDAYIVVFFGDNVDCKDTGVVVDVHQSDPEQSPAVIITVDI